jgi:flagellar biosynthesis/type III secretory pathway ATPase
MKKNQSPKMPKHISILGRKFSLKFTSEARLIEMTGKRAFACVCFETKTISIMETLSPEDQMISIIHEVTHIGHVISGLNQVISNKLQEVLCETNANSIVDLVKSFSK